MIPISFSPFPVLITPRMILRRPADADVADLFEMRSDPEVMRFIPRPLASSHADVQDLLTMMNDFVDRNERINWAMELKEERKVVGMIGFVNIRPEHHRAEVGYSLTRSYHRRGLMREALHAVLDFGFSTMNCHSVEAVIDEENIASGSLLDQTGFRREARFVEDFLAKGSFRNSVHFGMLRREWMAGREVE
jgi:ribosomal-protein-alanine N-acetyltransferase